MTETVTKDMKPDGTVHPVSPRDLNDRVEDVVDDFWNTAILNCNAPLEVKHTAYTFARQKLVDVIHEARQAAYEAGRHDAGRKIGNGVADILDQIRQAGSIADGT